MKHLLAIREEHGKSVVSARELHEFLEVKAQFTDWCKRMFEYGFIDGVDYSLHKIVKRSVHNKIDYALTLNCAKEISMIQRTDKGKEARSYFIDCEAKVATIQNNVLSIIENMSKRIQALESLKPIKQLKGSSETLGIINKYLRAPYKNENIKFVTATSVSDFIFMQTNIRLKPINVGFALSSMNLNRVIKRFNNSPRYGYEVIFL